MEIIYQLFINYGQNKLGKNNLLPIRIVLDGEKQRQNLK